MKKIRAEQGDNVTPAVRFLQQPASGEILLKGAVAEAEHAPAALDQQPGSLAQVANDSFALFLDAISGEREMFAQELLHSIRHPPTRPKDAAFTLHAQGQPFEQPAKFPCLKNHSVKRITRPGLALTRLP